ncbi:hypothetical protein T08_11131 [Trichinella sp. T8]|nr:hypothetical protein T08_11131 [Trichinella sp. T8]
MPWTSPEENEKLHSPLKADISAIPTPTLPPPTQCSVPHRQCLHQSFILLFHPAPKWYTAGLSIQHSFSMMYLTTPPVTP